MTFTYDAEKNFLDNKTILITGASDGIGKACAKAYAAYGATVVLLGRDQQKLETVFDEIDGLHPGKVVIHPLDFKTASMADFKILAESLNEQFECLDGLIHNAALLGARTPIEFYPEQDWADLMQVNVNAVFQLTQSLIPALNRSESAQILFISSSVGRVGRAFWGLMQTLAEELENTTSIRVNSLNPGGTRTNMRRDAYPAENPETQPTAESLMPVYLYLMSSDAQSIHGQALNVRDFEAV
jgi:NAD(P)-dependent dehydrogenase (short-subunit alcohol dehydrogenase family)